MQPEDILRSLAEQEGAPSSSKCEVKIITPLSDSVHEHETKKCDTKHQQTDEVVLKVMASQCALLDEEQIIQNFHKDRLNFNVREDFTSSKVYRK